jgi:hypothetical protein
LKGTKTNSNYQHRLKKEVIHQELISSSGKLTQETMTDAAFYILNEKQSMLVLTFIECAWIVKIQISISQQTCLVA